MTDTDEYGNKLPKTQIMEALLGVQAEAQDSPLVKNARNPHFKNDYVTLDAVLELVMPILKKYDVLLLQPPTNVMGQPALRTTFLHVPSTTVEQDVMPLVLDRENPQGLASAITYGRRYMLLSYLGLTADADDDGNAASKNKTKAATKEQSTTSGVSGGTSGTPF